MKLFLMLVITSMLATNVLNAKIIEVEDGTSFIGAYSLDESKSSKNGCLSSDSNVDEVQILGLPDYKGLKVVSQTGQHGQGEEVLFLFDLKMNGMNDDTEVEYINSEDIEATILSANQNGDTFLTIQRMAVDNVGTVRVLKTMFKYDPYDSFPKPIETVQCFYNKK